MPILLVQFLTKITSKINILPTKQNNPFQFYRFILKSCFLFGLLTYSNSSFCGDDVLAQVVSPPPDIREQFINNLNVEPTKLLKVPAPLKELKTLIKVNCAGANLFLFIHRPMNVLTPHDSLEDYAIWHDLRLSTRMDQIKHTAINIQKVKPIKRSKTHTARTKILQATKLVKTKDDRILLTGGVPIVRSSSNCHNFPFIYLSE